MPRVVLVMKHDDYIAALQRELVRERSAGDTARVDAVLAELARVGAGEPKPPAKGAVKRTATSPKQAAAVKRGGKRKA